MDAIFKLIVISLLIIPIIFNAVKYDKWYIYILFAFYTILPDTFAIEISTSLPLITGKRILIIIVSVIWFYNMKFRKRSHIPKELLIYTIVALGISLFNLRINFGEFNNIFIIIFEQFLLVMTVKSIISEEEEVYRCLEFLIYGSGVLAVISILQTVLKIDLTTVLAISEDRVAEVITDRMNAVRAFGVTNAIKNGCYCAFMCMITMFMYEKKKQIRYIFFLVMNIIALVCTMTRSAILALGITVVIMIVIRNRAFLKIYFKYLIAAVVLVIGVLIVKPSIFEGITEVIKSILNVLGFDYELSSDFGFNADNASYSRMVQWSAVYYMIKEGFAVCGYGYNAFIRGCLYYYFKQFGCWTRAGALDTGFVGIAVEGGLLGLINNIMLWVSISFYSFRYRDKKSRESDIYKLTIYMTIMYFIINMASAFSNTDLIWLYMAIFFAYREIKVREKTEI
jgi:hypothetical protein